MWEDRSGAGPVWNVEQPLFSSQRGDGSFERILTSSFGEFSGGYLAGKLECKPQLTCNVKHKNFT